MESKTISINSLQNELFELDKTAVRMNLSEVFADKDGSCLNEFTLFFTHFNTIPNFIHEINIDCKNANNWFIKTFKNQVKDWYYNKRYFNHHKKGAFDDLFYFLYDDLIVAFDTNCSAVKLLFRKTEVLKVQEIINGIQKFKERNAKRKPAILLLVNTNKGIDTKSLQITKLKLSIEDNYNDDFSEIHQIILKKLSKKNDKGLVLLHGKPGTGKTSYIRYLISSLKKDVIFLPPNMAAAITNPDLISILIGHPNSIFVIEDAENIVADREKDGHSPVSALLNISDGLLSDCLNIQIICSFNTDLSKVDSALLRKGRLIAKYEFKELEIAKAQSLSDKLSFDTKIYKPMTLSEIYNQGEISFQQAKQRNVIGFMANIN